jgi:hypothetical protein
MEFLKIENINVNEIKFSKTKSQRGRRFINAYYNKKILGLKFPSLRIPFNTKINQFGQLELNMSLDKNIDLIKSIKEIDEKMKSFCKELEWFPSSVNPVYTPMLKESTKGDYPPTIKLKIPIQDSNEIKTAFYDFSKKKMAVKTPEDVSEVLKQGTRVQAAALCVGIWFMDNKYGLSWKAEQVRITAETVSRKPDVDDDYLFCSDSDDESKSDTELLISDDEDN